MQTPDEQKLPRFRPEPDVRFVRILSTSTIAHLALLFAILITPFGAEGISEDMFRTKNRFVDILKTLPPPSRPVTFAMPTPEPAPAEAPPAGTPRKWGTPEDPVKKTPPKPGSVDVDKRAADRAKVGSLAIFQHMAGDSVASSLFNTEGLGEKVNDALGKMGPAHGVGDAEGLGGRSSRGDGTGGLGGPLGVGGFGKKAGATCKPPGCSPSDRGGVGFGPNRTTATIRVPTPEETRVSGGLAADVVARYIRRHQNEIRYCYEKHLQQDPNLSGKLAVRFIIDGTGSVAGVATAEDTLQNGRVADCVHQRIGRWKFPQPAGGVNVVVTFPWIFKPAG